jgi:O-antigen/teichoic acid export membrane protein
VKSDFNNQSWIPPSLALVAKNAGLLFCLQAVQRLFGLVTTYFVVRALSQEGFGSYQFVLTVVGVVSIFGLPGINNAVMQSVARGYRGTFRASIRPALLCSLIGSFLLVCVGCWYYFMRDNDLGSSFFLATMVFPLTYGLMQWQGLRTGLEDFSGVVKPAGAAAIATSLLLIGTVVFVTNEIAVLVAIILSVQAMLNLIGTAKSFRVVKRDEPVERGSVRYGLVTTAYMVFGHVAIYSDKLLIYAFMTPASLAIFVAAERIPQIVKSLVTNVGAALAPRFARHRHYTRRVDRAIWVFSIVAGLAIVVFAFTLLPWIVVSIYGDGYRDAVPYAQVLMCSVAIASSVPLRSRWIKSQQDAVSFRDVNAVIAICRIAVSAVLIPLFGLKGAVISAVLARITGMVTIHIVMKKRYPLKEDPE